MLLKAVMPAVLLAAASLAAQGVPAHVQTDDYQNISQAVHVQAVPPQANEPANPKPAATPVQPAPQPVYVSVQPGDTLGGVAMANHTTYMRLFDANAQISDPDLIFPGEQVRIPAAAEQLPDRPLPAGAPAPTTAVTSAPVVSAAPEAQPSAASYTLDSSNLGVWDRIARCESGGNWGINTGNGFYGGLQFTLSSWQSVGGSGLPSQASREEQIARAQLLQARQGWGAWPVCSVKAGV